MPLGRRDGLTASQSAVMTDLPAPFHSLQDITAKFKDKGLDLKDVVVLSGMHHLILFVYLVRVVCKIEIICFVKVHTL